MIPEVRIETYPDLWRKGRYRVDLTAELDLEIDGIDAALQQLDYHIIDADQWGQSYVHNQIPSCTAELGEVENPSPYLKVILRNGGLDETEITEAENYLTNVFDRIYQLYCERHEADEYGEAIYLTYSEKE